MTPPSESIEDELQAPAKSSTDGLQAAMPIVYILWVAVMIGLLLNLLLLILYTRQSIRAKAQLALKHSLESAQEALWQTQMQRLIVCLNLVPFCLLLLAGYRVCVFIQGLESTQRLREQAQTLFVRANLGCTITAVHHTVRVLENRGLTACGGAATSNVWLRIGAGQMDDVEARCQGEYGDVAFTFDDYAYDFNYSDHVLRSRGESFLRPFRGTRAAVARGRACRRVVFTRACIKIYLCAQNADDMQFWVDHPRSSSRAVQSTFSAGDSVACWTPIFLSPNQTAANQWREFHDWRSKFQCANRLCVKIFDPVFDLKDPQWHSGELELTLCALSSQPLSGCGVCFSEHIVPNSHPNTMCRIAVAVALAGTSLLLLTWCCCAYEFCCHRLFSLEPSPDKVHTESYAFNLISYTPPRTLHLTSVPD